VKQHLSDAIDDYRLFRVSQGRAALTLKNDKQTLVAFLTHVGNIYAENVTERHVSDFLATRTEKRGASSIGVDVSVLRCFFTWAKRTKRMHYTSDPMAGRQAPRVIVRERTRVHVSKFPHLLDVAEKRSPRNRAFVALALYTLCRTSEIETMRVGDLDLDAGYIRVKIHKSKREDRVPITGELDSEMRRWLTYYTEACGPLNPEWFLTPTRRRVIEAGTPIKDNVMVLVPDRRPTVPSNQIIRPALVDIGFTVDGQDNLKGEGAHTLRRSGARALFDALSLKGYDYALRVVQAMLHHKNLSQTEHYIGISADRKERDQLLKGQSMFDTLAEVSELKAVN
jgi:integrase